jgi:hypothetical protein
MPRPAKRQETETIEITVPVSLHTALVYLASHTPLGMTENGVAVYLLTKEIDRMQKAGEYGLRMPVGAEFAKPVAPAGEPH